MIQQTIQVNINGSLFDLAKQSYQDFDNTIFFESKAYHDKNYSSYLMLGAFFKVEVDNQNYLFIPLHPIGKNILIDYFHTFKVDYTIMDSGAYLVQLPEKVTYQSQNDMIKTHMFFNHIRNLITFLSAKFKLSDSFIFPMIFSYDLVDHFYDIGEIHSKTIPDFQFYFPITLYKEDLLHHQKMKYHFGINSNTQLKMNRDIVEFDQSSVAVDVSDDQYAKYIDQAKSYINDGEVYQLVVSRTFTNPCHNSFHAYEKLRELNPSPYMFFVKDQDEYIFGASPERAVQFTKSTRTLSTSPIAGTKRRPINEDGTINFDRENKYALELKLDQKETAEHIMLVDLARNDISSICEQGTRNVSRLMEIETYSHVLHLVSEVEGKLKPEYDALHAYTALMNMGTLTGSPKFRAYQLLREIEQKPRGYYGGSIGFITVEGDLVTAIIIRSAHVRNNIAYISAGAGIVYDSEIQSEVQESRSKAEAVISAITQSNKELEYICLK